MILYVFHAGGILRGNDQGSPRTLVGDCAPETYDAIANDHVKKSQRRPLLAL